MRKVAYTFVLLVSYIISIIYIWFGLNCIKTCIENPNNNVTFITWIFAILFTAGGIFLNIVSITLRDK